MHSPLYISVASVVTVRRAGITSQAVLAAYSTRLLNGFCLRSETPLREDKQCTSAVEVSHYLNTVHSGSQPSYGMEF
ncbi:hypothetical protein CBS11232_6627 [Aspergillus niger]|nr:hypothetical protein CBS11232_6627 [Aspergillus niger]